MNNQGANNTGGNPRPSQPDGNALLGLNLPQKTIMGVILVVALVAFELFNFDTTRYALSNLLGDVRFAVIPWMNSRAGCPGWSAAVEAGRLSGHMQQLEVYGMSASLLEIVDLGDGEIVLQRAEGDSEPLVTIRFSDESRIYLMDNGLEVAKAMIQAGIQAAAAIAEQNEAEASSHTDSARTLH